MPCKNQTQYWSLNNILTYNQILKQADKIVYISEQYTNYCTLKRNEHLVKNSSYCISYLKENKGGTSYTVSKAKNLGLVVYNIADILNNVNKVAGEDRFDKNLT